METLNHYIDGKWRPSSSGATFDNYDPARGTAVQRVAAGGGDEVNAAVAAAQAAFDGEWGAMTPNERGAVLNRIADTIESMNDELAEIETRDVGKPISNTRNGEMPAYAAIFRYFAGACDKLRETFHEGDPNYLLFSTREPYGACGLIVPWNYPALVTAIKAAPALAAGNTLIIKDSEDTPASGAAFARVCETADVPRGVVNVVHGYGKDAGRPLALHRGVPKVSFTGSTVTGRDILQSSVETLKAVTLELGGKSANLVFADADLDAAVEGTVFTACINTGQICTSASRLVLHESIADEFLEKLIARMAALRIGDPMDETTTLGPLTSQKQYDKVNSYLNLGKEEGELLWAGELPEGLPGGWFVAPHLFKLPSNDCRMCQEEIFGPVQSVLTFGDDDEALAIANDVTYGLATTYWTRDLARAGTLWRKLKSGVVWCNTCHYLHTDMPYGGAKQSGVGLELGLEGMKAFMQPKCVYLNCGPDRMVLQA